MSTGLSHGQLTAASFVKSTGLCPFNPIFFGFNANVETLRGRNVETLGTT